MRALFVWSLCVVIVAAAVGCGGTSKGKVYGKVSIDGTPVEDGSIQFTTKDGKGAPAGGPIKDGQYSVELPTGSYKVAISWPKGTGKKNPVNTDLEERKEMFPEKYNVQTELTFDVTGGEQEKNWELKSK